MALLIGAECISCQLCESECPNEAISPGEEGFVIDPARCTECVGHFEKSQCMNVCPADCIAIDPARLESREQLHAKHQRMSTHAA